MSQLEIRSEFKIHQVNKSIEFKTLNVNKSIILKIFEKKLYQFNDISDGKKVDFFLNLIKLSDRLETPKELDFFRHLSLSFSEEQKNTFFEKCLLSYDSYWKYLKYLDCENQNKVRGLLTKSASMYESISEAELEYHGVNAEDFREIFYDLFLKYQKLKLPKETLYNSVFSRDSKYYLENIDLIKRFKSIFEHNLFRTLDYLVGFYLSNEYNESRLESEIISNNKISIFTRYLINELQYVHSVEHSNLNVLFKAYRKAISNLESVFRSGSESRYNFWENEMTRADKYLLNKISDTCYQIAFFYKNIVFVEVSQHNYSTCLYKKEVFESQILNNNCGWHVRDLDESMRNKVIEKLNHAPPNEWQRKYRLIINDHCR